MTVENLVFRPVIDLVKVVGKLSGPDVGDRLDAFNRMDPISAAILSRAIDPVNIIRADRIAIAAGNVD
ncbi:hypothetical protein HYT74_00625 [Candidatus Daviesbacteria bacterium]|nr:hypothetical protein [Candidatus Daviesbacteria bacterium]